MQVAKGSEQDAVDCLVGRDSLTMAGSLEAERLAQEWGAGPIDVILATGLANPRDVADAIAASSGLAILDARSLPPNARAVDQADLELYSRTQVLPWGALDGQPLFAVVNPYTAQRAIEVWLGPHAPFHMVVTTAAILTESMLEVFGTRVVESAIYGLSDAAPEMSARHGIPVSQAAALAAIAGLIAAAFIYAPGISFTLASLAAGVVFMAILIFRLVLMIASTTARRVSDETPVSRADLSSLPVYTILVALRDEARLLPQIVAALDAIDYPATKLDILLLLEESDPGTRAASRKLELDGRFRVLTVPDQLPRTKPKACNFGLAFARGDFVVIYDAEDRPAPEQLMRALGVFAAAPETQCVQARLSFYNASENWLTRQFAIEFSLWFCFLLPGLARLGLPIPLGGTSNHFRRAALERAGGWDAFNVTEDADIGIRMARMRRRVHTIVSDTAEEANCELANWLHQRSRWLKGYMQTWLVHMRAPGRLRREIGDAGFWSFQLLIGGAVLSALLHLVFWTALVARLCGVQIAGAPWAGLLWPWTLTVLIVGNGLAIVSGIVAAFHPQLTGQGRLPLVLSALSMPLYWFLISFAAIKALISLVSRPFYWAKTRHGISRLTRDFAASQDPARRGPNRVRSGQA